MPVYVCVWYVGHLPVFPGVVAVLLLRSHRLGGKAAGSHYVLPVWSVCVCVVCVLMWCRSFCVAGCVSDRALVLCVDRFRLYV